jgi:hypothetical protein
MPQPRGCEELRCDLSRRGREAVVRLPEDLRAHVDGCPTCRLLVAAVGQVAGQPGGSLYTPALRRRTLVAVRQAAPHTMADLGWILLPPAGLGALAGTVAPVWILARLLQELPVSPVLAWTLAALAVLSTSLAASGLVAILVGHPREGWPTLTGAIRSSEV